MHIVLISQCQHRAVARTARVLDAYARRAGDRTWMTPITREGLQTLHALLRSGATRQTAVACYVSRGLRQMKLLWVVGAKGVFGPMGDVAVASRRKQVRSEPTPLPPGWRVAALLARLAGLLHDLGKFGVMFQDKLAGKGPMADAVRHEWLSLHIIMELKKGSPEAPLEQLVAGWSQAWATAASPRKLRSMRDLIAGPEAALVNGLRDPWSALLFLVFTHHRLPGDQGENTNRLSDITYIRSDLLQDGLAKLKAPAAPSAQTLDLIKKTAARLAELTKDAPGDPAYWRAVASLARMGLILADHSVSGTDKSTDEGHGALLQQRLRDSGNAGAFANTVRAPDDSRKMNQELNWHLQNVGIEASEFVSHFARFEPPGLSEEVARALLAPTQGRFAWQGHAADALRTAQQDKSLPTLVFNVAGTGCGKTRMNVVAVAALRDAPGNTAPIRLATALNLRTLTLQTRDAYADLLGMGKDELACVIGSAVTQRLHEARTKEEEQLARKQSEEAQSWGVDEDGNLPEEDFDASGDAEPPPAWLEHFLMRKPKMRPVIMSPVLVCTIDHLIKAGELTEQGNHALANLRLMTSDLVLDEIDSYDPKALAAVMRLITAAAFWGRHVIASSATLSSPVALAIWQAYELGASMRAKLHDTQGAGRFRVAMIDDKCPARHTVAQTKELFGTWFTQSLQGMLNAYGKVSYRPAQLAPVDFAKYSGAERHLAVLESIENTCRQMHERHRWEVQVDGQPHQLSIGLVRIANITKAAWVAQHLSKSIPQARIACYHSNLPRITRFMLERELDRILTRKDLGSGPQTSLAVQEAVRRSMTEGRQETMLIVVATPVEEIGRDHDFDWAVIEPSSVQSIVQTTGRVNRHRLVHVAQPNVAVLQFNFRHALGKPVCFTKPGLEAETPYETHDLSKLLNWGKLGECGQLDSRARFNSTDHLFARCDDQSTEGQVREHSWRFLDSNKPLWMGSDTYAPLRDKSKGIVISQDESGRYYQEHMDGPKEKVWLKAQILRGEELPNAWLAWSFVEALAEASRLKIRPLEAFAVELRASKNQDLLDPNYLHSNSLGYVMADVSPIAVPTSRKKNI